MDCLATRKRGGDPDVPHGPRVSSGSKADDALEEGLEESMAGSDPVSITQPAPYNVMNWRERKRR